MRNLTQLDLAVTRNHEWELRIARAAFGDTTVKADPTTNGAFIVRVPGFRTMAVIACAEDGWDHVSVSLPDAPTKTPSWHEMSTVQRLFFLDHEPAMQLHVPVKDHINIHNGTLHLWRPHDRDIPLPPASFV